MHQGTILIGDANVKDDAQIEGPDTLIAGSSVYEDTVGVGGSPYRDYGSCEFSGYGSYVDMTIGNGAACRFTEGTLIGGPVTVKAGSEGVYKNGEDGKATMIFASREGSEVTLDTRDGFESNGMAVLDASSISGSFKGNPEMIVQNSEIDVEDVEFNGAITVVDPRVDAEAAPSGTVFENDEQLDAVAKQHEDRTVSDDFDVVGVDQSDYRAYVDQTLAHEMGEQFSDTQMQNHYGDDLGTRWMAQAEALGLATEAGLSHAQLEALVSEDREAALQAAAELGLSDEQVEALMDDDLRQRGREALAYQDGRNDAIEEDGIYVGSVAEEDEMIAGAIAEAGAARGQVWKEGSDRLWNDYMGGGTERMDRVTTLETQHDFHGGKKEMMNDRAAGDLQGGISDKGRSSRYFRGRPLPEGGGIEDPQAGDDGHGLGD